MSPWYVVDREYCIEELGMGATVTGFYSSELDSDALRALVDAKTLTHNEIVEGLYHGDAIVRRNASRAAALFDGLPDPGHTLLRIGAKDSDEQVRMGIVAAMAMGSYPLELAIAVLFDGLSDPVEDISDQALQGLELQMARSPDVVIPILVAGLYDPRPLVAAVAVDLLIKASDKAVTDLVPMLSHGDPNVRRKSYDVFERIRWQAVGPLIGALRDPVARPLAKRLLLGVGEVEAIHTTTLKAMVAGDDPVLAEIAALLIADFAKPAPAPPRTTALELPEAYAKAGFFEQRIDTATLDGMDADGLALDDLLYATRDGRPVVRSNALGLLARSKTAKAVYDDVV
ncbi:MAG: HEAT repeat protein, partial [Myxococcota bacterium]